MVNRLSDLPNRSTKLIMRLMFLTSRLPYPPDRGDRSRVYHFLRTLSAEHEITLVTFSASESERPYLAHLHPFCKQIHVVDWPLWRSVAAVATHIWRPLPLQLLYYRSAAMTKIVDELLTTQSFDAVYVHLFRMAPYLVNHNEQYRILDLTDVVSNEIELSLPHRPFLWRWLYRFELPRIRRYEAQIAMQVEENWLISAADEKSLTAVAPQTNNYVVPIGVKVRSVVQETAVSQPPILLFVGNMSIFHNIDAVNYLVKEIFPLVGEQLPGCQLHLVGASVSAQIRELEAFAGVSVLGFVPELDTVYAKTAVFVAPMRFAAGIQTKVLDAMGAAVPVVTTSLINAGLGARPEHDLLLADEAQAFAAQIIRLLRDAQLRTEMGRSGQRFVQQKFSWDVVAERMRQIESRLIK